MIGAGLATIAAAAVPAILRAAEPDLKGLEPITGGAKPIDAPERARRLARAQALMKANGIGAVLIEPGASMIYFTGVRWWLSERLTCAILPVEGEPCIVTPFFEEPSVRLSLAVPAEVRTWNEDADPLAVVAGFLKDRRLAGRPMGIEERVRFFVHERLGRALPGMKLVSADPVVRGCRMIKTPAEIALMQAATDVTIAAYRWVHPRVEAGMTGAQVGALMDCGCAVEDYQSDVSRTFVVGSASAEQRKVWGQVKMGQALAFRTAQIGVAAGAVDDAVRGSYAAQGYGPDYTLPGLSHRTGHGIGMEGHEPVNLVRGEGTRLAQGMCFSDEPGLYLPGRFGVRLEDCFHMTAGGPVWFSRPPESIDAPMGDA